MLRRKEHLSVVIFTALAVAGTALLSGCGSPGQSPLASDQGTAFSSDVKASAFLTKRGGKATSTTSASSTSTPLYHESDTKNVYSWDEEFNVRFRKYGTENDVRVKDVKFYVEANSVVGGGEHQITMGVHSGTTLDDVNIEFSPSGLAFSPAGTLTIALVGPVTAADVQQATHIYGDGSQVESITTVTDRKGNSFLKVVVKVPGFSRYSLGGGDDMYEMVDDEGWW